MQYAGEFAEAFVNTDMVVALVVAAITGDAVLVLNKLRSQAPALREGGSP